VPQQLGGFLQSNSDAVSEQLGLMQTNSADEVLQQLEPSLRLLTQLHATMEDVHKFVNGIQAQQETRFRLSLWQKTRHTQNELFLNYV
jgi:hypothetical protein